MVDGLGSEPRIGDVAPEARRAVTIGARARRLVLGSIGDLARVLQARGVAAARPIAWLLLGAAALAFVAAFALALALPQAVQVQPPLGRATRLLRLGRTCAERRAAALELVATGDRRYLDELEAARDRREGLFGSARANACMQPDLEAAIARLRARP